MYVKQKNIMIKVKVFLPSLFIKHCCKYRFQLLVSIKKSLTKHFIIQGSIVFEGFKLVY